MRGYHAVDSHYFYGEMGMITYNDIKMAVDFFNSVRVPANKPMETLQAYADLCAAQARAIENYARVVNRLKDELDTLRGVK